MRFIHEYRDPDRVSRYAKELESITTREWTLMEVCGGQTHSILRFGIDRVLPEKISLLHGPGCPVCVTPIEMIDRAISIASKPNVILCSFGDMLRVPGSRGDLLTVKSSGGDVRIVYSPLDALKTAMENPDKEVVFFAVGFETTAPANAMAVFQAHERGVQNFSMLVSHVLVPPALEAILSSGECRIDGFLAAGHVCTVMGEEEYRLIAEKYKVPIVIMGFEPVDILAAILACVHQLEEGRHEVENAYQRVVRKEGNREARRLIREVFEIVPRKWRGIGLIPNSGLGLQPKYSAFDAEKRFPGEESCAEETTECISGLVLQGAKKPTECPAFGTRCTPEHPLGATMVSAEGACAAYFEYRPVVEKPTD